MSELHEAVELLLKRMETHPEEFPTEDGYDLRGRWAKTLRKYSTFLTEAEETAIKDAKRKLCMQRMHEDIMKELLAPEENNDVDAAKLWTQMQQAGLVRTASLGPLPLTTSVSVAAYPTHTSTFADITTTDAAAARLTSGVSADAPKGLSNALKGWFK